MISIITGGKADIAFSKQGVTYYRCEDTGTLFSKPLPQEHKVGGEAHEERNNNDGNLVRIIRICELTGKEQPVVLDYGCGQGQFVNFLRYHSYDASGYDPFSNNFTNVPFASGVNKFDAVTMIEVVEHLTSPFREFQDVYNVLKPGGILYLETSFIDFLTPESDYINPELGHGLIWSHAGLDYVMQKNGFKVEPPINRNTRIYSKP